MTSFNFIGSTWAGACKPLITNVLRDEWGYNGIVITDACMGYGYMDASKHVYAGSDMSLMFGMYDFNYPSKLMATAEGMWLVRNACHRILYVMANSGVVNIRLGISSWQRILIIADTVIGLLLAGAVLLIIRRVRKHKKTA